MRRRLLSNLRRPSTSSTCRPSGRASRGGAAICRPSPTALRGARRRSRRTPANALCFPMNDGTGDTLLAMLDRPAAPRAGAPLVLLIHGLTGSRGQPLHPDAWRACCSIAAATRAAAQPARRRAVAARCAASTTMPAAARTSARCWQLLPDEPDARRRRRRRLLAGRRDAAEVSRRGGRGSAAARGRHGLRADRSCRHLPAHDAAAQRALSSLHPRPDEGRGDGRGRRASRPPSAPPSWAARTLWDYDDVFIAPRYGFASAEDYYESCWPMRFHGRTSACRRWCWPRWTIPGFPAALYSERTIGRPTSADAAVAGRRRPCRLPRRGQQQPWSDLAVARFLEQA